MRQRPFRKGALYMGGTDPSRQRFSVSYTGIMARSATPSMRQEQEILIVRRGVTNFASIAGVRVLAPAPRRPEEYSQVVAHE